jgi:hypothetical protein
MCEILETRHTPLTELMALLPDSSLPDTRSKGEIWENKSSPLDEAIVQSLPILRIKADGCPVCIFAALRQAKISVNRELFDFKAECKSALHEI